MYGLRMEHTHRQRGGAAHKLRASPRARGMLEGMIWDGFQEQACSSCGNDCKGDGGGRNGSG